ncbi:MAG: hypothetical protein JWO28_671 [Hyphomicrobiales bacterium]|jgi:hypothetical protein|nr:hypothetical protein [Hyphomicrobiales bacterium]
MSILLDVAKELFAMFLTDLRLAVAVLALVVIVAGLVAAVHIDPVLGGGVLLLGCIAILLEAVLREAKRRRA